MDPIEIPLDDEPTHDEGGSFCSDPTCPCHEDAELIAEIAELVTDGTLTSQDATDIVNGKYR
jgi:hypothetical protein